MSHKPNRLAFKTNTMLILLILSAALDSHASNPSVSASIGAYTSQGNYGSENPLTFEELPDTEVHALPFSLKYKYKAWSLSLHSAYVSVDGKQSRLYLDDEFELQSETNDNQRSGFSDISIKTSYKLPRKFERTTFRLGAKVKLPTSSKKNKLGSGEYDYSPFFNTAYRDQRNLYFSHIGYQISGDTKETNYNNRWFGRAAMQRIISKHILIGGNYSFKQASTEGRSHTRKLGLSATWIPNKNNSYSLFSGFGFSDATADWSLGVQSTYKF